MESDLLVPEAEIDANQELARRLSLIYRTHDGGLNGFFKRIEHDQQQAERHREKKQGLHLKRLIDSSVAATVHRANPES